MWPLMAFAAAGLGAAGKLYAGFAGSSAARLSAGIERDNAALLDTQGDIAKDAAGLSLTRGGWEAGQVGRKLQSTQAATTSYFAGRNIDPGSGSPLMMEGYSAAQGATDMALAGAKGEVGYAEGLTRASNIYGQAASQRWKAAQDEQTAITSRISGIFGAGTALLSAAASPWAGIGKMFSGTGSTAGTFTAGNPWDSGTGGLY